MKKYMIWFGSFIICLVILGLMFPPIKANNHQLTKEANPDELSAASHIVMLGEVDRYSNPYRLDGNRRIYTDVYIKPLNIYKNLLGDLDEIKLRLVGGKIAFTEAEMEYNLELGKKYILFLGKANNGEIYIRCGPSGIYEIDQEMAISKHRKEKDTKLNDLEKIIKDNIKLKPKNILSAEDYENPPNPIDTFSSPKRGAISLHNIHIGIVFAEV